MPDNLIINAHHRLRWHQRLVSWLLTTLLWAGWFWLWRPILQALQWLGVLKSAATPAAPLLASDAISLEQAAFALVATAITLLLWRRLPAHRVREPKVETLDDYARHFGLPADMIHAGRHTQVSVMHHDEHGRIVHIEPREARS